MSFEHQYLAKTTDLDAAISSIQVDSFWVWAIWIQMHTVPQNNTKIYNESQNVWLS